MRSAAAALAMVATAVGCTAYVQSDGGWTERFALDPGELASTGRNPYFVLEPGWGLVLADGDEQLVITVLPETRVVNGIETRVVEERETDGGELVEVSRNFLAISRRTNSVFYFGEEVDIYEKGVVVRHEGAWMAGENGARFGLMMPGLPLVDGRYYQEIAPRVAMDRARIVSLSDSLRTPAGAFTDVLTTEESTPLEPTVREHKRYAPGIGLIQDESLVLVRYGNGVR